MCNPLKKQLLPHNFHKRPVTKPHPCICKFNKYDTPDWETIPLALSYLEMEDFIVLTPFDIDCGTYERMKHGYRVKRGAFKLTTSKYSVEENITSLSDCQRRQRCRQAYTFLMNCSVLLLWLCSIERRSRWAIAATKYFQKASSFMAIFRRTSCSLMEHNFHHWTKRQSSLALKPIFASGSSGLKWHSQKWQTPLKPVLIL